MKEFEQILKVVVLSSDGGETRSSDSSINILTMAKKTNRQKGKKRK